MPGRFGKGGKGSFRGRRQPEPAAVEELSVEQKAVRAFSRHHRRAATVADVVATTAGIAGWAAEYARHRSGPLTRVVVPEHTALAALLQERKEWRAEHPDDQGIDAFRQQAEAFEAHDGLQSRRDARGQLWWQAVLREGVDDSQHRRAMSLTYGNRGGSGGDELSLWSTYLPADLLADDPAQLIQGMKRKQSGPRRRDLRRRVRRDGDGGEGDDSDAEDIQDFENAVAALKKQLQSAPASERAKLQQRIAAAEDALEAAKLRQQQRNEREEEPDPDDDAGSYDAREAGEDDLGDDYDDGGGDGGDDDNAAL
eukprot:TRINITY_DN44972_c0_g1_i1.p2 TRINITY_DN44972_c0_g1~~TRINITY_DN44972_c0_g1_i1.p2  ORF type:complete len:311 (+),score=134.20 TRINITY_DN44972_c0_g1_i1:61-993(+)